MGGTGGSVIEVTNTDDSGPGSLRAALEASGPRVVVPKVSGYVTLAAPITVNDGHLTYDGVGKALCLRNASTNVRSCLIVQGTEEIVLRNLRVRPGFVANVGDSHRALTVTDCSKVVVDHCSFTWGIDICAVFGGCEDVTVQWSIFSEGLNNAGHPAGPHARGVNARESSNGVPARRITFHHNLSSHVQYRTPQVSNSDEVELINNVVYQTSQQGTNINMDANNQVFSTRARIWNNHYSRIGGSHHEVNLSDRRGPDTNIFVKGNIGPNRPTGSEPELDCVDPEDRDVCQSSGPKQAFPHPAVRVPNQSAVTARTKVLEKVGANLPYRDAVDERLVQQAIDGTGSLINHPDDVGGYPVLI